MAAVAPTVSINDPGDGQGGTSVSLSVVLGGGTYTSIAYAWTVSAGGGSLSGATTATPTWTRPDVDAQTRVEVRCDVTVTDSSDSTTATNFDRYSVFVNPTSLPDAVGPLVTIEEIPTGNEGTTASLAFELLTHSGPYYYDSYVEEWETTHGSITNFVWTRPQIDVGPVTATISARVNVFRNGHACQKRDKPCCNRQYYRRDHQRVAARCFGTLHGDD